MKSEKTKYNIIIFYEHISRELPFVNKILQKFEEKNIRASAYSYLYEYYKCLDECYDSTPPTHLIVPYIYSKNSLSRYRHLLERFPDLQIINMHHEQLVAKFNIAKAVPQYKAAIEHVFHVSWGENYTKMLLSAGASRENIIQICSPRLTQRLVSSERSTLRKLFASEFDLDINKKWILFCEDRDWTLKDKKKVFTVMENLGISKDILFRFYKDRSASLSNFFKKINMLDDAFFSKYELIYRPHPGVNGELEFENAVQVISKYSVYDWFQCIELNVVDGSTSCFESDSLGVMTSVYQVDDVIQDFQVFGISNYYRLNSFSDLLSESIITILKNQIDKEIYKDYIGDVRTDFPEEFTSFISETPVVITATRELYQKHLYFLKKWLFERIITRLPKKSFSLVMSYFGYSWIENDKPQ